MSDMFDHAAYLSETIGPRPAGTEEERQAALYVAETFQRKAGLQSQVEDFTCPIDFDLPRAILCGISIVMSVLSIIFSIMVVPAFIVTLACAVLYGVEVLVRPVIARAISHGASQNVVARYEPNEYAESSPARHRKVILLSHYDSGKVQRELQGSLVGALPIIRWVEIGAMVLIPLLLLIRLIFIPTGAFATVMNVLSVIAIVGALLPIVATVMKRTAPYNDGANCNASGIAVLLEVAQRVRDGRNKALAEEAAPGARIHGAAAAKASGLVPEGAELVYETDATVDDEANAEDRLMAAKAAVAMLTGKPVSATVNIDLEEDEPVADEVADAAQNAAYVANALEGAEPLSQSAPAPLPVEETFAGENSTDEPPVTFVSKRAQEAAAAAEAAAVAQQAAASAAPAAPAVAAAPPTVAFDEQKEESSVPDWFTAARAKAKQNVADIDDNVVVQRSRYAEAMEMAQREIDARIEAEREEAEASTTPSDTEARLQEMRAAIIENYPTSSEAAAAAAKKAAEAGAADQANVENATTAFAPVMIDGEQLKQEAAMQTAAPDTERVIVQGTSSEITGEMPVVEAGGAPAPAVSAVPAAAASAVSAASVSATPVSATPAVSVEPAPTAQAVKLQSLIPQLAIPREKPSEEQQARQASLRSILPSLSGSIKVPAVTQAEPDEAAEKERALDSLTDSFSPATATAVFSAVDENDYEEFDEEYADDIDETGFEAGPTESTGLVEMPKSRAGRLFGKFRKNKKAAERETSAHEWLDVDDDFDARAVGEARGGWESFREDYEEDDVFDDFDDGYDDFEESGFRPRRWNGGAFSRESFDKVRGKIGHAASRLKKDDDARANGEGEEVFYDADGYDDAITTEFAGDDAVEPISEGTDGKRSGRAVRGGRSSRRTRSAERTPMFSIESDHAVDEQQAIRDFHEPNIEIEVWFVALGAELAGNGGIDAFITEHRDELKGAVFVDVEALGAGELTLIEEEGMYFPVKASSRMERYSRKAAASCGLHIDRAKMLWRNSAAAAILRNGNQAMHLAGMKDGKPAYCAQRDDTMANIDEDVLSRNADFLVELLRSI